MRLFTRIVGSLSWDEDRVSDRWLQEHQRKGSRIHFEGVHWKWPVQKLTPEPKWWRRRKTKAA